MSKRRLTNREQLRKNLKEAEPNSILYRELEIVQTVIEEPREKAVPELIKLLKVATTQVAKHFIAATLGSAKDPRAIRPLMQAAVAPENQNYSSNFRSCIRRVERSGTPFWRKAPDLWLF